MSMIRVEPVQKQVWVPIWKVLRGSVLIGTVTFEDGMYVVRNDSGKRIGRVRSLEDVVAVF